FRHMCLLSDGVGLVLLSAAASCRSTGSVSARASMQVKPCCRSSRLSRARKSRMPAGPGLPTMRSEKTARRGRPSALALMASPSARGAKCRVQRSEVAARVVVIFLIDPELTSQGVREHGNGAADVVLKKLMEGVRGAALELVGQLGSEAPALGGCVLSTLVAAKRFSVGVGLGC